MVTISNGVKSFKVPSGAVKAYEPAGYHVVGKGEEQPAETLVTGQHKHENDDIDVDGEDDAEGGENQESDADDNFVAFALFLVLVTKAGIVSAETTPTILKVINNSISVKPCCFI